MSVHSKYSQTTNSHVKKQAYYQHFKGPSCPVATITHTQVATTPICRLALPACELYINGVLHVGTLCENLASFPKPCICEFGIPTGSNTHSSGCIVYPCQDTRNCLYHSSVEGRLDHFQL